MTGPMHGSDVLVTGGTGGIGAYFADRRPKRSSRSGYDLGLARRLWEVSGSLVGRERPNNRPVDAKEPS